MGQNSFCIHYQTLISITTNYNDYKQPEASIKRLQNINLEPIEDDIKSLQRIYNIEGKIDFKEVNFEYKKDNPSQNDYECLEQQ